MGAARTVIYAKVNLESDRDYVISARSYSQTKSSVPPKNPLMNLLFKS